MRYVSFIHRSKAGYGVSFPDFPGCVSVGDTVDDAIHLGSEVLAFHVEGLAEDGEAIPEPRTIDAIKADPGLADWRREADLALIPLLLDRGAGRNGATRRPRAGRPRSGAAYPARPESRPQRQSPPGS